MRKCRCRVVSAYQIMMTTTTTTMMMISCVNMCICQVYFTINLLTCLSNCSSRLVARGRIACRITLRMSTARMPGLVPACLRQKYPFPWRIRAPLNTWFLGTPESTPQTASWSVQSFYNSSLSWPTDRQTRQATWRRQQYIAKRPNHNWQLMYTQAAPIENNPLEKKFCISAVVLQIWAKLSYLISECLPNISCNFH